MSIYDCALVNHCINVKISKTAPNSFKLIQEMYIYITTNGP